MKTWLFTKYHLYHSAVIRKWETSHNNQRAKGPQTSTNNTEVTKDTAQQRNGELLPALIHCHRHTIHQYTTCHSTTQVRCQLRCNAEGWLLKFSVFIQRKYLAVLVSARRIKSIKRFLLINVPSSSIIRIRKQNTSINPNKIIKYLLCVCVCLYRVRSCACTKLCYADTSWKTLWNNKAGEEVHSAWRQPWHENTQICEVCTEWQNLEDTNTHR